MGILDCSASTLNFVLAVMAHPRFAEDFQSEFPEGKAAEIAVPGEGVGGGSQTDDRFASVQIVGDMDRFAGDWVSEARADNHQIGGLERIEPSKSLAIVGIDIACVVWPEGKQDGTPKSMTLAEDFAQHRQSFFGPILFVSRHQDDVFGIGCSYWWLIDQSVHGQEGLSNPQPAYSHKGRNEFHDDLSEGGKKVVAGLSQRETWTWRVSIQQRSIYGPISITKFVVPLLSLRRSALVLGHSLAIGAATTELPP